MKKMFKRVLATFLALIMVFGAAPLSALSEIDFPDFGKLFSMKAEAAEYSGECGENLTWTLNTETGTLSITGTGAMKNWSDDSKAPWYSYRSIIKTVNIEKGITIIGVRAFYNCVGLTSITIPDSVTSIGNYAFEDCSSLTSVTFGNSVTSIGFAAFRDCTGLTSITIPDSVTSIGGGAFYYCTGLTSITIPDSVTSIGYGAFYYCTGLTSIIIPDSVTSIGNSAINGTAYYNNKSNWESGVLYIGNHLIEADNDTVSDFYTIKDGTLCIADSAFRSCSTLVSIVIPDSVIGIGEWSFCECVKLESVTIPDSVTCIGERAFCDCTSLKSITVPDSVSSIGRWAFYNTPYYKKLALENGLRYIGNHLIEAQDTVGASYSRSIKDGTLCIADYAFSYCGEYLLSVTIPDSVTTIGDGAFAGCTGLTSITIPDSVTSIGDGAFAGCTGLTSITIPDSVTSIGESAFSGCDRLESVTIGNSVTSIGNCAFYGCTSLTSVTIGNSVTSIGFRAFEYCANLTSITIPVSVTSIGYEAFYGCNRLSDVYYMGTEVEWNKISIGYKNGCLTNATIHFSHKHIEGEWEIVADSTATNAGEKIIRCIVCGVVLKTETISLKPIHSGSCGETLTWSLYADGNLLIAGTGYMYDFDYVDAPWYFYRNSIKTITVEDGVMSIGSVAFSECKSLTSIIIPTSVKSIGDYAFLDCEALSDVYYKGTEEEWNNILIGSGNYHLLDSTIHYNFVTDAELNYLSTDEALLLAEIYFGKKVDASNELVKQLTGASKKFDEIATCFSAFAAPWGMLPVDEINDTWRDFFTYGNEVIKALSIVFDLYGSVKGLYGALTSGTDCETFDWEDQFSFISSSMGVLSSVISAVYNVTLPGFATISHSINCAMVLTKQLREREFIEAVSIYLLLKNNEEYLGEAKWPESLTSGLTDGEKIFLVLLDATIELNRVMSQFYGSGARTKPTVKNTTEQPINIVVNNVKETESGLENENITISQNDCAVLPDCERNGYNFTGWYRDEECTDVISFDDDEIELKDGTEIYAGWEPVTVRTGYELHDGYSNDFTGEIPFADTVTFDDEYVVGAVIVDPPAKPGYSFSGWYEESTDTTYAHMQTVSKSKWSKHVGFTALYSPKTYLLTFNANGGACDTLTKSVKFDDVYGELPVPNRDGFVFLSWKSEKDGSEISSDTIVKTAEDLTLTAIWALLGDVFHDDELNLKDAVIFKRFLAEWSDISFNSAVADVNGDGTLSLKDVVLIERYLAGGWGVTLI